MTGGELIISAGTMYGTLSKMEKDGLIVFEKEEEIWLHNQHMNG